MPAVLELGVIAPVELFRDNPAGAEKVPPVVPDKLTAWADEIVVQ